VRLVEVPLVGGAVLVEDGLGVGAMAEDGGDGDQHGQHGHGEGDGAHRGFVRSVLGVLAEFLGFVGFHGAASHLLLEVFLGKYLAGHRFGFEPRFFFPFAVS
jgi:hypothetical protein